MIPELYFVRPEDAEKTYPLIKKYIEPALYYDGFKMSHESIIKSLKEADMLLWVAEGLVGCCITEITQYANKKVLIIVLAGGENMNHWGEYLKIVETYAKASGCDYVEIYGRPGWEKVLPAYKKSGVILRKTING